MTTNRNLSTPPGSGVSSPVDVSLRLGGAELDALGHGVHDINSVYIDVFTRLIELGQLVFDNPALIEEFDTALRSPGSGFDYVDPINIDTLPAYLERWTDYVTQSFAISMVDPELDWTAYVAKLADLNVAIEQYTQIMESWKGIFPAAMTVTRLETQWSFLRDLPAEDQTRGQQ